VNPNAFKTKVVLATNHFDITLGDKGYLYQYVLDTDPQINDDSIQVLKELVFNIRLELKKTIGLMTAKGKILWGTKSI
jgi:hypothetical protein